MRFAARLPPLLIGIAVLMLWEGLVRAYGIAPYVLPSPSAVIAALWADRALLFASALVTLEITFAALIAAALGGGLLALLMAQSRWVERSLFPYAVAIQVTPVVAIAPLIIIWVDDTFISLLLCAWIVAFFPVLSNTMVGLNSTDRHLADLFRLYGAGRWKTLRFLKLPAALPYYLAGLRISGGLALIGAVVAEFVAGTGGTATGLAFRVMEAGFRLQIPRMFAALVLLSLSGIAIFWLLDALSRRVLRHWHESARDGG